MKRAQNRRCTSSICEQSLSKVCIKKNKNFLSYRLHKLGTLKCFRRMDRQTDGRTDRQTDGRTDGRPDGWSGPTTRPAFAKATQVKMGCQHLMPKKQQTYYQLKLLRNLSVKWGLVSDFLTLNIY